MQVRAKANFLRVSPRKIRLVIDVIRGWDVSRALVQLDFINKAAAKPVKVLLESAVANAIHNFKLEKDNLYIAQVIANEGPTLKRWTPKAFGRATTIRKRSTHLWLTLAEKVPTPEKEVAKKTTKGKKKLEVVEGKFKEEIKGKNIRESKEGVVAEGESKEIFDVREKGKHREGMQNKDRKQMKKGGRSFTKKLFNRKSG